MTALATVGALAVGAAFGYGARRGAFCMNSGFLRAWEGDWTKVQPLGLAVAVQLLALPALVAAGLARPPELPLPLVGALAGGLIFGLSMRWAGGCAAGIWYKLGAGDMGALPAIFGMALGATAADAGPLAPGRLAMQRALPNAASWAPPPLASLAAGLLLLAAMWRLAPRREGAWDWRATGLWVGAAAAIAWPVSASAGRDFGLAVVPGAAGLLAAVAGRPFPAWDVALLGGLVAGGWLAARVAGPVRVSAPQARALLERFAGGVGLGVGASLAGGCTVGQGLTGLPLLAPTAFVVMGAIFAGSGLAAFATRRLASAPGRPAPAVAGGPR